MKFSNPLKSAPNVVTWLLPGNADTKAHAKEDIAKSQHHRHILVPATVRQRHMQDPHNQDPLADTKRLVERAQALDPSSAPAKSHRRLKLPKALSSALNAAGSCIGISSRQPDTMETVIRHHGRTSKSRPGQESTAQDLQGQARRAADHVEALEIKSTQFNEIKEQIKLTGEQADQRLTLALNQHQALGDKLELHVKDARHLRKRAGELQVAIRKQGLELRERQAEVKKLERQLGEAKSVLEWRAARGGSASPENLVATHVRRVQIQELQDRLSALQEMIAADQGDLAVMQREAAGMGRQADNNDAAALITRRQLDVANQKLLEAQKAQELVHEGMRRIDVHAARIDRPLELATEAEKAMREKAAAADVRLAQHVVEELKGFKGSPQAAASLRQGLSAFSAQMAHSSEDWPAGTLKPSSVLQYTMQCLQLVSGGDAGQAGALLQAAANCPFADLVHPGQAEGVDAAQAQALQRLVRELADLPRGVEVLARMTGADPTEMSRETLDAVMVHGRAAKAIASLPTGEAESLDAHEQRRWLESAQRAAVLLLHPSGTSAEAGSESAETPSEAVSEVSIRLDPRRLGLRPVAAVLADASPGASRGAELLAQLNGGESVALTPGALDAMAAYERAANELANLHEDDAKAADLRVWLESAQRASLSALREALPAIRSGSSTGSGGSRADTESQLRAPLDPAELDAALRAALAAPLPPSTSSSRSDGEIVHTSSQSPNDLALADQAAYHALRNGFDSTAPGSAFDSVKQIIGQMTTWIGDTRPAGVRRTPLARNPLRSLGLAHAPADGVALPTVRAQAHESMFNAAEAMSDFLHGMATRQGAQGNEPPGPADMALRALIDVLIRHGYHENMADFKLDATTLQAVERRQSELSDAMRQQLRVTPERMQAAASTPALQAAWHKLRSGGADTMAILGELYDAIADPPAAEHAAPGVDQPSTSATPPAPVAIERPTATDGLQSHHQARIAEQLDAARTMLRLATTGIDGSAQQLLAHMKPLLEKLDWRDKLRMSAGKVLGANLNALSAVASTVLAPGGLSLKLIASAQRAEDAMLEVSFSTSAAQMYIGGQIVRQLQGGAGVGAGYGGPIDKATGTARLQADWRAKDERAHETGVWLRVPRYSGNEAQMRADFLKVFEDFVTMSSPDSPTRPADGDVLSALLGRHPELSISLMADGSKHTTGTESSIAVALATVPPGQNRRAGLGASAGLIAKQDMARTTSDEVTGYMRAEGRASQVQNKVDAKAGATVGVTVGRFSEVPEAGTSAVTQGTLSVGALELSYAHQLKINGRTNNLRLVTHRGQLTPGRCDREVEILSFSDFKKEVLALKAQWIQVGAQGLDENIDENLRLTLAEQQLDQFLEQSEAAAGKSPYLSFTPNFGLKPDAASDLDRLRGEAHLLRQSGQDAEALHKEALHDALLADASSWKPSSMKVMEKGKHQKERGINIFAKAQRTRGTEVATTVHNFPPFASGVPSALAALAEEGAIRAETRAQADGEATTSIFPGLLAAAPVLSTEGTSTQRHFNTPAASVVPSVAESVQEAPSEASFTGFAPSEIEEETTPTLASTLRRTSTFSEWASGGPGGAARSVTSRPASTVGPRSGFTGATGRTAASNLSYKSAEEINLDNMAG